MAAAIAAPAARAAVKTSAGRTSSDRSRPGPGCDQASRRNPKNSTVATSTWKVDSGCPPKKASATSAASPAPGSAAGRRTIRSDSSSSHGSSGNTFVRGQASQATKKVPNEKTRPASSAPPKRIPSARPSRNVPRAATHSFSAAITASDFQNGSA